MVDRPHGQDVFQMPKATLHFGQLFVQGHRVRGVDVLFAGGHHILAFQTFLAFQMDGMVEKPKGSLADLPSVVAIALMSPQGALGGGADLRWVGQGARRHACLHLLQLAPGAFHGLLPFALFVLAAFVGIDDEHALVGIAAGDFLHARARRVGLLLACGDAHGTIQPRAVVQALQPTIQLGVAATFQTYQIAVAVVPQRLQVVVADHAPITDEDDAGKGEARHQVAHHFLYRCHIQAIAGPDVMGNRPARHQDQADDDRHVLRLAVTAVTMVREILRPLALEVAAGDVEQHQVRPQAEQVPQALVKPDLDGGLGRDQAIEGAIPGIQLLMMDLDAAARVPVGPEAPAAAIADEVGLQPAGQTVLAARLNQPIGQQHESPIAKGGPFLGFAEQFVEQLPQSQLVEEGADNKHGPPGGGFQDVEVTDRFADQTWLALEQALQLRQQCGQDILAAEVGDRTLFDLAVLAVGLDDANVLIDGALGGGHLDGAEVHGIPVSRRQLEYARSISDYSGILRILCVTTIFAAWAAAPSRRRGKTVVLGYVDNRDG